MRRFVIYCLAFLCAAAVAVAEYKVNIGAFQKDSAGSDYTVNIGADQTDEAEQGAPPSVKMGAQIIVIQQ